MSTGAASARAFSAPACNTAVTALQRRGIASRLLVNPNENHWVLKPKNSLQWYGEVIGWMDKWTAK